MTCEEGDPRMTDHEPKRWSSPVGQGAMFYWAIAIVILGLEPARVGLEPPRVSFQRSFPCYAGCLYSMANQWSVPCGRIRRSPLVRHLSSWSARNRPRLVGWSSCKIEQWFSLFHGSSPKRITTLDANESRDFAWFLDSFQKWILYRPKF